MKEQLYDGPLDGEVIWASEAQFYNDTRCPLSYIRQPDGKLYYASSRWDRV